MDQRSPNQRRAAVIMLGNVPFASAWQRSQQLALCLAEHRPVVYVDPNRSFLQRYRRSPLKPIDTDLLPSNLHLFRPPVGLPLGRTLPWLNRINYRQVFEHLRSQLNQWRLRAEFMILSFPDQFQAVEEFRDIPVVYDLMDEPSLFLKSWQKTHTLIKHQQLLARADLLVTSSHVLCRRYQHQVQQCRWITNGIRDQLFTELEQQEVDPRLASLPRPRLGYVGMISHWFDFDVIRALATSFSSGSIVLIGSHDVPLPKLPTNVTFLGPIPHLDLASVFRGLDLGLIPFRRDPAIDAVNPIKMYEYLAAGLPILSAYFQEMDRFSDKVTVYRTSAEAVKLARELLEEDSPERRLERKHYARQHTWRNKSLELNQAIQELLEEKKRLRGRKTYLHLASVPSSSALGLRAKPSKDHFGVREQPTPSLSVIMPAYNEESAIERAVQEIQDQIFSVVPNAELVVINDGSRDETGFILDDLAELDERIKVIHQKNAGHGPALWNGMSQAQGTFFFLVDSDLQIPLTKFAETWQQLQTHQACFGLRIRRHDPPLRLKLTKLIRRVLPWLFGVEIYDANVPYKLFPRFWWQEARRIIPRRTLAPSLFLALYAFSQRYDIFQLEVPHQERSTGVVSIRRWGLLRFCLRSFIQLLSFRRRMRYCLPRK